MAVWQGLAEFVFWAVIWIACMVGLGANSARAVVGMTLLWLLSGAVVSAMVMLFAFAVGEFP
ncbi:hypothetical protein [Halomonas sp. NO4]|uniref:hypothetical protein n=1 Tax=Halomonas sp. NO4 TaxID=2484813 RepID=UPI0013D08245|nr:hypothetical protein [Halomonas sp. NO4]